MYCLTLGQDRAALAIFRSRGYNGGMDTEKLKKKYFPRVPWTEDGPVRRRYCVRAEGGDALAVLAALAEREGFTEPGQETVAGGTEDCLEAFGRKAAGEPVGMVFGDRLAAHWCDIAADPPDEDGWQRFVVRSEEGENLTALAHNERLLQFKKA